jgi:DNA polymerase III delta subunit
VTTTSLAFFWGDDELSASRALDDVAGAAAEEAGMPLERWRVRGDEIPSPATLIGRLNERIATAVLFGGGTLAVVSGVGPLVKKGEDRDALIAAIGSVAPGNALAFLETTESGRKEPPHKAIVDAVTAHGGVVRRFQAPKAGALAGWIEAEARTRGVALAVGAAKELATRVGGFVHENDADRGQQTRLASMELGKLGLFRPEGPVTAEDVRAVVAEAVPSSLWGLADAVGQRRVGLAIELLEVHLPATPEPVLVTVLHRRIRELLEIADRLAAGESPGSLVRTMKLNPYRAEVLVGQARRWTVDELVMAIDGLVELDATVRGAPGSPVGEAQHRLAFGLWIAERVGSSG